MSASLSVEHMDNVYLIPRTKSYRTRIAAAIPVIDRSTPVEVEGTAIRRIAAEKMQGALTYTRGRRSACWFLCHHDGYLCTVVHLAGIAFD